MPEPLINQMSNEPHRKRIRHIEGLGHVHELTFSCYRRRPLLHPVRRQLCEKADQWKSSIARVYLNGEIAPDPPRLTRPDPMWPETSGVQVEPR